MAATKQQSALAKALQALKSFQDEYAVAVVHGSEVLGAENTKVLVENGFLEQVIKGWYIPSNPSHAGTAVTWYASFWGFVSAYCANRFGEDWCLTPEESLCVLSGATVIPQQVIVRVRKGSNTVQSLLHGTSIFNLTAKLPSRIEREPTYGLNVYPLAEALLRCSPDFYLNHPIEIRACLNALTDDENLSAAVRDVGGESYAGRLIGALRAIGRLPCVDAGLLSESDLAGYRRGQVYIAGSRYTPPPAGVLPDVMDAFFDLVRTERDYRVRAVLGHFFFVHIHPYADGNGRTARFIMNASLVAGGGRWTVIPVDVRERYMKSLEVASVEGKIGDFLSLLNFCGGEVNRK